MSEPVYTHRSRSQALEWDSPPPPAPGSDSCQLWLGFRGEEAPMSHQPMVTAAMYHKLTFIVIKRISCRLKNVKSCVLSLWLSQWCWCYFLEFETCLKFYILMTSPVIKVLEVCEFKSSTLGSLTINYENSQCSDEISAFSGWKWSIRPAASDWECQQSVDKRLIHYFINPCLASASFGGTILERTIHKVNEKTSLTLTLQGIEQCVILISSSDDGNGNMSHNSGWLSHII